MQAGKEKVFPKNKHEFVINSQVISGVWSMHAPVRVSLMVLKTLNFSCWSLQKDRRSGFGPQQRRNNTTHPDHARSSRLLTVNFYKNMNNKLNTNIPNPIPSHQQTNDIMMYSEVINLLTERSDIYSQVTSLFPFSGPEASFITKEAAQPLMTQSVRGV